jgi:hypothetical protein
VKKNILYWTLFIIALVPGSLIALVLGIQGTIYLWGKMIEWGF